MTITDSYIRVVNWERYQHYKHRNPPWIKLYGEMLSSRTWVTSDDSVRVLALAILMLAGRNENRIPADPAYLRRVAYLNSEPDFESLVSTGFIEIVSGDASNTLATCKHDASNLHQNATPEKRQRQSRGREEKSGANAPVCVSHPTLAEVTAYCQERENNVDPQLFMAHYESNGWKIGKVAMKNWKAAVITWEKNGVTHGNRNKAQQRQDANIAALNSAFPLVR